MSFSLIMIGGLWLLALATLGFHRIWSWALVANALPVAALGILFVVDATLSPGEDHDGLGALLAIGLAISLVAADAAATFIGWITGVLMAPARGKQES